MKSKFVVFMDTQTGTRQLDLELLTDCSLTEYELHKEISRLEEQAHSLFQQMQETRILYEQTRDRLTGLRTLVVKKAKPVVVHREVGTPKIAEKISVTDIINIFDELGL